MNFLLPGLGSIYGRKIKKGLLLYLLFMVVVLSVRFIAYNFTLFAICIVLVILYYLSMIVVGYKDIEKGREYSSAKLDKWYVYVLIIALQSTLFTILKGPLLDHSTPINFARIPTPAMDPTLVVGDVLAFQRTQSIQRNNVVIFWKPEEQTMYIKRCVGMPGDSLQIKGSKVFINGHFAESTLPLKYRYEVTTDGSEISARILEKLKIDPDSYSLIASGVYSMFLTTDQARELSALNIILKTEPALATEGESEYHIYPNSELFNWNTDFYGPLYIPKTGDEIQLTNKNIALYLSCIKLENSSCELKDSTVFVNGRKIASYRFSQNYYFMMGDSRHNSLDSRYWGFLPQSLVIGKAMYLYWAANSDRIGMSIR